MSMLIKKLLTISLRSAMIVTIALCFSACKKNSDLPELNITYNNVRYHRNRASTEGYYAQFYNDELKEYGDWYYNAGPIQSYNEDGEQNTIQFIASEVNGIPVMGLGYTPFMTSVVIPYGSTTLKSIYTPGTIVTMLPAYFNKNNTNTEQINWFYCGKPINLYNFSRKKIKIYIPNEKYSDFVELLPEISNEDIPFYKANISYKLNMTELPKQYKTEYYYIDYVEYGKTIENIPPEPTVKGYKFNGWYTEADCINKWNFENTLSHLDKDEDFNELCLYAKWIKD